MNHAITIATKSGPIDTLEPPTMGTLYRWECSCGKAGMSWRVTHSAAFMGAATHWGNAGNRGLPFTERKEV